MDMPVPQPVVLVDASRSVSDDPHDWEKAALCSQSDPELFFPEQSGASKKAKEVCGRCPVRAQCLATGLANDERHGIWGGLSTRERHELKKTQQAAA